jgi:Trehalose utilisation
MLSVDCFDSLYISLSLSQVMLKTNFVLSALALASAAAAQQPPARILLYTATTRYRHDSIPAAVKALQSGSPSINAVFDNTEDKSVFTDENLAKYDAVAFLSTSGDDSKWIIGRFSLRLTHVLLDTSP